jgi:hypothetical protein
MQRQQQGQMGAKRVKGQGREVEGRAARIWEALQAATTT